MFEPKEPKLPLACAGCGEPINGLDPRIEITEQHAEHMGDHARGIVAWAAVVCSRRCAVDALTHDHPLNATEEQG